MDLSYKMFLPSSHQKTFCVCLASAETAPTSNNWATSRNKLGKNFKFNPWVETKRINNKLVKKWFKSHLISVLKAYKDQA